MNSFWGPAWRLFGQRRSGHFLCSLLLAANLLSTLLLLGELHRQQAEVRRFSALLPRPALEPRQLAHARSLKPGGRRLAYMQVKNHTDAEANSGCVQVDTAADDVTLELGTLACNGHRCPPCFEITSGNHTLVLLNCSRMYITDSLQLGVGPFASAVQSIMFVNLDRSSAASVSDGTDVHSIEAGGYAAGACHAVDNTLFMNGRMPTTTTPPPLYVTGTCYSFVSYSSTPSQANTAGSWDVRLGSPPGSTWEITAALDGSTDLVSIKACGSTDTYWNSRFNTVRYYSGEQALEFQAWSQWEVVAGLAGSGTVSFIFGGGSSTRYLAPSNGDVATPEIDTSVASQREEASWTLVAA